ncbi:hypothetical protein [Flexivirga oryzae]|uniref:Uncharacterized protein n=1 Tax=Flexivirga oryzae TaxID=1794944 RepID=A0A839NG07_9MICO|nr:hypothetical protein [Flexivirga oryzae]MBB2894546.1 hypothetical protein [Flexivirga oryzae]
MLTDALNDGGNESVAVTAGIWGFLVLFGLAIACWLLFRSMNNHLRKAKWQDEQDHPVRQRIPNRPRPTPPAEDEAAAPDVTADSADGKSGTGS